MFTRYTTNSKGFKVLNNVRLIQGDGVNELTIRSILGGFMAMGWSADNIAFGNLFYGENGLYKELPKPSDAKELQVFYNIVKTSKGV